MLHLLSRCFVVLLEAQELGSEPVPHLSGFDDMFSAISVAIPLAALLPTPVASPVRGLRVRFPDKPMTPEGCLDTLQTSWRATRARPSFQKLAMPAYRLSTTTP